MKRNITINQTCNCNGDNYTICELADKLPHEEFIEYLKDNGIYIVNEGGVGLG